MIRGAITDRYIVLTSRLEELEIQVAQLAADKASLENENRLLKAIVLGAGNTQRQETFQAAITAAGDKRKRDSM